VNIVATPKSCARTQTALPGESWVFGDLEGTGEGGTMTVTIVARDFEKGKGGKKKSGSRKEKDGAGKKGECIPNKKKKGGENRSRS